MSFEQFPDHRRIENVALRVLEDFKIDRPVVDVVKIANGLGVEVKEVHMPKGYEEVAGFYEKASKVIYVEENDPPQRKLFSIAHELGHIFLGHQQATVLYRIIKEDQLYSGLEQEANSFAAHLLMPVHMLRYYMDRYDLGKSDYAKLATIFGVPASSMKYTLERLSDN